MDRDRRAGFDSSIRAGPPFRRRACGFSGRSRSTLDFQIHCFRSKLLASGGSPRDTTKWPDDRSHDAANWPSPLEERFLFLVVACSAACLLKAADSANGLPMPPIHPLLATPIAGRAAISPAAPVFPEKPLPHFRTATTRRLARLLSNCGKTPRTADERAYLGYLQGITERLAGRNDAARTTLRAAAAENPTGRWLPKIRFELASIELAAGQPARGRGTGSIRGHPPAVRRSQGPPGRGLSCLRAAAARAR